MPRKSDTPDRDPMAGEVERLLRQLGPKEDPRIRPRPPKLPDPGRGRRPSDAHRPRPITLPSPPGVWARAALGVVLAAALTQWPYSLCGLTLAGYFVAAAFVVTAGAWAAHAAWRRRMGPAHTLAIAVVFAGIALAAHQVLARVGYTAVQAAWGCPG